MTERLGIVYTPVEVVDFIIHSVNEVLKAEFDQTLGSKGVHILDPFTGTGTFITRLLQSGLIAPEELAHKYQHEIHANEIVLLAYYIAAINIEAVYHTLSDGDYRPFEGICLTDTFQLYEQDRDLISDLMADNSNRRTRQKALDIRVIVGNPPYSVGQGSTNDNAANVSYPKLDRRIRETYAAGTSAVNKNALYDSYIRAIRWASDRVGDSGIVAYVSNAGWIDGNAMNGLRKSLVDEYSDIYIFHLRGNARTSGERRRKEKDNVFGQGTRTPVAITLLVKNPDAAIKGRVFFHDIGDYLGQREKLDIVSNLASISGIAEGRGWQTVTPDEHGDWLGKRDADFDQFLRLGSREKDEDRMFERFSSGVQTNRDPWAQNFSADYAAFNMSRMVGFYDEELARLHELENSSKAIDVEKFISNDESKISWTRGLKKSFLQKKVVAFSSDDLFTTMYRPFTKQWIVRNKTVNEYVNQVHRMFPYNGCSNRVIATTGVGGKGFSTMMMDVSPDVQTLFNGQCFPLYLYDTSDISAEQGSFLATQSGGDAGQKVALTNISLLFFQSRYPDENISKEDLFYYTYGLLHSTDYRDRYADNLSKELPRIPAVKGIENFRAFVEAGRKLGDLHVGYESVEPYPVVIAQGDLRLANIGDPESFYRVEQMKFAGKRPKLDKATVIYNAHITMSGVPLDAYEYVVNGKPALEWVMERQCVKTDKASGIVNDANRYAIETAGDPAYPMLLFQRMITVSLETMKIVRALPPLDIQSALGTDHDDAVPRAAADAAE